MDWQLNISYDAKWALWNIKNTNLTYKQIGYWINLKISDLYNWVKKSRQKFPLVALYVES